MLTVKAQMIKGKGHAMLTVKAQMIICAIDVASITQLCTYIIKIVSFKVGHLMW